MDLGLIRFENSIFINSGLSKKKMEEIFGPVKSFWKVEDINGLQQYEQDHIQKYLQDLKDDQWINVKFSKVCCSVAFSILLQVLVF